MVKETMKEGTNLVNGKKVSLVFFIFLIVLFTNLISPDTFSDGMFLDGEVYAAIARNMAQEIGSSLKPHLSNGLFPLFNEHPPFALWLQSLAFRVFGDSIFVERAYSFLTYIVVFALIALVWQELTGSLLTGWFPILFYILTMRIYWGCANNPLENTMAVFVLLATWLFFKGLKKQKIFYNVLSGLALSLGFLSKGPTGLYIWVLPFFWYLFKRDNSLANMLKVTGTIVLFTIIPILIIINVSPGAAEYFNKYFNAQIMGNLGSSGYSNLKFSILKKFIQDAAPALIVCIIVLCINFRQKIVLDLENKKTCMAFFLLTLSGVLPICLGKKQTSFYILTVYPFLGISLAILLVNPLEKFLLFVKEKSEMIKFLSYASVFLTLAIPVNIYFAANHIGRDKILLTDTYKIIEKIGHQQNVSIPYALYSDWGLHAYMARKGNVSLTASPSESLKFHITTEKVLSDKMAGQYIPVNIDTARYMLFEKADK